MLTFDNVFIRWDGSVSIPETEGSVQLKGIEKFIDKLCVQQAIYWGNPVANSQSKIMFDPPRVIRVRWDEKIQIIKIGAGNTASLKGGKEETSVAELIVKEDLELQGMLVLYTDETASEAFVEGKHPMNISGARKIIKFDKVPMVKSSSIFIRKVFLS